MKPSLFALVLSSAIPAMAVEVLPTTARAQQPPALGDEVRLKNGSVYRGTITESVPKDHVDLLLANGQTKRFAAADIASAGPAATPQGPGVGQDIPSAPVHVEGSQEDLQLLIRSGQIQGVSYGFHGAVGMVAHAYDTVCTAPCDVQLPIGQQRLALSYHGGAAIDSEDPVEIRGPSTLHTYYDSRVAIRVAGYIVGVAGVITGLVLVATSYNSNCDPNAHNGCSQFNTGQLIAGGVTLLGSAIVGGILSGIGDKAVIQVVPTGSAGPLKLPGTMEAASTPALPGAGLALQLKF
jgi:hypothetical protein